ncbi:hypothetical protein BIV25_26010 [Streptomyces sp. MUSC 14]|uniref:hypothetical protein n=1 Tax=Streptomyces sp. MUSC 14 TaxID=1354889 RepID=UPI0008F5C094|nr:hypothetical protein [Streptomyces sp. MUSC 14]OIJ93240.1 hypothetical protein BIV25_26010 [Streptomyces sp. MUSC 14]
MENTRIAEQAEETGAPLTDAEKEQAGYALRELARSESGPDALRVSAEQLEMVRPFFELGWALGVRTGHTGPAVADVPVDRSTVARAFMRLVSSRVADRHVVAVARSFGPQQAGPLVWQRVRYHGSLTRRHGRYWVQAIHVHGRAFGLGVTLRYDLCELLEDEPVSVVTNVRRQSLTPLPEYRTSV